MNASRFCSVEGCQNRAPYLCPKCRSSFCSVVCYPKHSHHCLSAFASESSAPLRNINVSEEQRRRFHNLLLRAHQEEEWDTHQVPCDDNALLERNNLPQGPTQVQTATSSSLDNDGEAQSSISQNDDDDDPASLLQRVITDLDDNAKDALFTVLHKAMQTEFDVRHSSNSANTQLDTSSAPSHIQQNAANSSYEEHQLAHDASAASRAQETVSDPTKTSAHSFRNTPGNKQWSHSSVQNGADVCSTADILEQLVEDIDILNLGPEDILARLPPVLARDFQDRVKNGHTDDLIQLWRPWWEPNDCQNDSAEQHIGVSDGKRSLEIADLPPLPTPEKLLVDVGAVRERASPAMLFNVIDMILGYCVSCRLCNGDIMSDPPSAARILWEASATVGGDVRYNSIEEVCVKLFSRITKLLGRGVAVAGLIDTAAILGGCSSWVTAALFETERLLNESRLSSSDKRASRILKGAIRKVAFFVSWALGECSDTFLEAARAVNRFVAREGGRNEEMLKMATRLTHSYPLPDSRNRRMDIH